MKQTLLLLALLTASVASAQPWGTTPQWTKSLTPVTKAENLAGTHVAVARDNSVVLTGTYDQPLTFGATTLENDDALASGFVAKYGPDGSELWAAGFYGAAYITAVATDEAGAVYATGVFADEVKVLSTDGKNQTIQGMTALGEYLTTTNAAFIAKWDQNGALVAVRTILPETDATVAASEMYFDSPSFSPNSIRIDGGEVYVGATCFGNVKLDAVDWHGAYVNIFDFMYADCTSAGVIAMDGNLANAHSVYYASRPGVDYADMSIESLRFDVAGGTVYTAVTAHGSFIVTTAGASQAVALGVSADESGNTEHAFVLTAGDQVKAFNVAMHDQNYGTDRVAFLQVSDGKVYVAGTYYNQLGFDTAKTSTGCADIFAACLSTADLTTVWAATDGYDEGDVKKNEEAVHAVSLCNGQLYIAGVAREKSGEKATQAVLNRCVSTTGTMTAGADKEYADLATSATGFSASLIADGTTLSVSAGEADATAVTAVRAAKAATGRTYDLSGREVKSAQRGAIIVRDGRKLIVK